MSYKKSKLLYIPFICPVCRNEVKVAFSKESMKFMYKKYVLKGKTDLKISMQVSFEDNTTIIVTRKELYEALQEIEYFHEKTEKGFRDKMK